MRVTTAPIPVNVNMAIDQGGCIGTRQETTHRNPTGSIQGMQDYAVGHMPGAVPFTSTEALVSVISPYILGITRRGLEEAITKRSELLSSLNTIKDRSATPVSDGLPTLAKKFTWIK